MIAQALVEALIALLNGKLVKILRKKVKSRIEKHSIAFIEKTAIYYFFFSRSICVSTNNLIVAPVI